jgi:pilus assembly protein Flp/PilA
MDAHQLADIAEPDDSLETDFSLEVEETGQGLAEYALILALIAIISIVALLFLGGSISQVLLTVSHSV